jgi:hypothetical protein
LLHLVLESATQQETVIEQLATWNAAQTNNWNTPLTMLRIHARLGYHLPKPTSSWIAATSICVSSSHFSTEHLINPSMGKRGSVLANSTDHLPLQSSITRAP